MNNGMNQNQYGMNNGQQPMNNGGYGQQPMGNGMPMNNGMNQGYQQPMNNGGYGQQPMMNQPMNGGMPMQGQPMMGMAPQGKKSSKNVVLIAVAVIVGIFLVYNFVLTKSLKCTSSDENDGAKEDITLVVKERFGKIVSLKSTISYDLTDFKGDYKDDLYKLLDEVYENACKDYDSGCSKSYKKTDKKYSITVKYSGKGIDKYKDKNDVDDDKFNIDYLKENADDDETCK